MLTERKTREYLDEETIMEELNKKMPEISSQIDDDTVILCNLEGAKWFLDQLLSRIQEVEGIDRHHQVQYIKITSATGLASQGEPQIVRWLKDPKEITGRKVVVIEDINDTGKTLSLCSKKLQESSPSNIATIVLYDKDIEGKVHAPDIAVMKIEDKYVIGTGLDDGEGNGRELEGLFELTN